MLALLLFSCATDAAPAPAAPPPPVEGPKAQTLLGEVVGVAFVGDWTSDPCPGRTYARNIYFGPDNSWAAVDLVSPCPVGKQCMWSGLVGYNGIWKQQNSTDLALREIGAPIQSGSPHPTLIQLNPKGELFEGACTYRKGLTVPPGYTEDQVRPRPPLNYEGGAK